MDAIRKKMQSLKAETDQLHATIAKYEEETKESNKQLDQHECDIRDIGKKIQNYECDFDETNDKLTKVMANLEEREKSFKYLPKCLMNIFLCLLLFNKYQIAIPLSA